MSFHRAFEVGKWTVEIDSWSLTRPRIVLGGDFLGDDRRAWISLELSDGHTDPVVAVYRDFVCPVPLVGPLAWILAFQSHRFRVKLAREQPHREGYEDVAGLPRLSPRAWLPPR